MVWYGLGCIVWVWDELYGIVYMSCLPDYWPANLGAICMVLLS